MLALIFLLASQLGSDTLSSLAELPLCFDILYTVTHYFPASYLEIGIGPKYMEKIFLGKIGKKNEMCKPLCVSTAWYCTVNLNLR